MLEEPVPQVVDHPLARVDLHLRAVGRHELIHDLQHDAGDDDDDEQRHPIVVRHRHDPRPDVRRDVEPEHVDAIGQRLRAQDVVDHDRERPRLQARRG